MKIYKALFSLGLASAVMHTMAFPLSDPTEYSNDGESAVSSAPVKKTVNPLLQKSTLPFGAPDFKKIKVADYLPAIEEAIQEQRDKIKSIVNNIFNIINYEAIHYSLFFLLLINETIHHKIHYY